MKKILLTVLSVILILTAIYLILVFGFNFRETKQSNVYNVSGNPNQYEVAESVIKQKFEYHKTHGIDSRILDYKIRSIQMCDETVQEKHIGNKNGFVFALNYDVKPFLGKLSDGWHAGNGEATEDGWSINKTYYYMIIVENDKYILEHIGTDAG